MYIHIIVYRNCVNTGEGVAEQTNDYTPVPLLQPSDSLITGNIQGVPCVLLSRLDCTIGTVAPLCPLDKYLYVYM